MPGAQESLIGDGGGSSGSGSGGGGGGGGGGGDKCGLLIPAYPRHCRRKKVASGSCTGRGTSRSGNLYSCRIVSPGPGRCAESGADIKFVSCLIV